MQKKIVHLADRLRKYVPFVPNKDEIDFRSNGFLTMGVEIELQLIDGQSLNLVPKAEELLKAKSALKKLKPEFYLSTVEINTDIHDNICKSEEDLAETIDGLSDAKNALDLKFATTGCHPFSRYADCVVTPSERYNELIDRNQWLTRRMTVYGTHVHIGMKSGDDCIRYNNFFLNFIPHLLALSASSPFWQGDDTGLASSRPTTYEALPTAGQPYNVRNWREFETLYHVLKKCKAINSLRDLWWDMRPSPNYGTLEIRVCDGLATLAETAAVSAFIHLLAHWFSDNGSWLDQITPPPRWLSRENKWRVLRYGMEAELVNNIEGETKAVRADILEWLEKLEPYSAKLGYQRYVGIIRSICRFGNSSERQRAFFTKNRSLKELVAFNIREFEQRSPTWEQNHDTKTATS